MDFLYIGSKILIYLEVLVVQGGLVRVVQVGRGVREVQGVLKVLKNEFEVSNRNE